MGRRRLAGVLVAAVLGAWTLPVLPAVAEPAADPVEVAAPTATPSAEADPATGEETLPDAALEQSDPSPEPSITPVVPLHDPTAADGSSAVDDLGAGAAEELRDPLEDTGSASEDDVVDTQDGDTQDDGAEADGAGPDGAGPDGAGSEEVSVLAVGDVSLEIASASCLPAEADSATITAVVGNVDQSGPVGFTVNLLQEDSDGVPQVITSETGSVSEGETQQLVLSYVVPGPYQVEVVLDGEDGPSATVPVQPVRCLAVESDCESVTFLNDEGNPAVLLSYTDVYSDGPTQQVEIASGGSLTLFDSGFSWNAVSSSDQVVRAGQGFAEPTFGPCEPELGSIDSDCSVSGAGTGLLTFDAVYPAGADVSWQVLDAADGRVVAAGPFGDLDDFYGEEDEGFDDGFEDEFLDDFGFGIAQAEGLGVGDYQVVLVEDGDAVQTLDATVLTCLDVTAVCDDVTATNPSTNPAVYGAYFEGDGLADDAEPVLEFELDPGQTRTDTLEVEDDLVLVVAVEASDLDFDDDDSLDFGFDYAAFQQVELGQGCAPEAAPVQEPPAGPGQDVPHQPTVPAVPAAEEHAPLPVAAPALSTVSGPLADTGGPVGWLVLFGGLTLLAGATLLVGRRRT